MGALSFRQWLDADGARWNITARLDCLVPFPVGAAVTQANGREGAFNGVGRRQVPPVLFWEVVEGELGIPVCLGDHEGLVGLGSVFGQGVFDCLQRPSWVTAWK